MTLTYRNMWFGKRKDGAVGIDKTLIPGWLPSHSCYRTAAVVVRSKSY